MNEITDHGKGVYSVRSKDYAEGRGYVKYADTEDGFYIILYSDDTVDIHASWISTVAELESFQHALTLALDEHKRMQEAQT